MESQEAIKKKNVYRVAYIGVCFTTLFTAYIAAQNLVSQIYKQLGFSSLGQTCIFIFFSFFGLTSVVAAHFKKKISLKTGFIFGACAHINFVLAGTLTTFCNKYEHDSGVCSSSFIVFYNISSACVLGFGAAFLWLCQALYVDGCADAETKGILNGLFWSLLQCAQIFSSALAAFLLGSTDQFTFYLILLLFGFTAIGMLSFVKPPVENGSKPPQIETNETLAEALQGFKNLAQEKMYYFLFIGIVFSGVAIGFYISFLATAVGSIIQSENTQETNKMISYVLLVLSCGEVIAGLTVGKLADKYDKIKLFTITMIINEVALVLTFLACLFKSYYLAILAGWFWGYGDTAIQTMINTCIGSMFGGRPELFSAYRFYQGIGEMIAAILAVFLSGGGPILYILVIAGIMMVFHVWYIQYLPKNSPQGNVSVDNRPLLELKDM